MIFKLNTHKIRPFLLIFLTIILICSPVMAVESILIISNKETGKVIWSETVKSGEKFILTWKNSLFNVDVTETYIIKDAFFEQTGVIFHDPEGKQAPTIRPEEVGDFYHTGGAFKAENMSRAFKSIVFRIGEIGNPIIKIKGKDINLKSHVGFGGAIVIETTCGNFLNKGESQQKIH